MAALHARCFTVPRPWSQAEFASFLADPAVFALHGDGALLLGRVVLDEAELLTLAVAPETRRQGLGRRLLAGFVATAGARGARHGFLEVAADNGAALALYLGHGWSRAGRRRGYYTRPDAAPVDALTLTRILRPPPQP